LLAWAAGGTVFGATAAETSDSSSGNIEEIVVTAEKTVSTALKTPIALSVFTPDELRAAGVVNIDTLGNLAPSVSVTDGGHGPLISIRGVTTTDNTSKGEPAVSLNFDGIAIGRPQIMQLGYFDLERIEILRGPQGTLYGQSSTGGSINVITAKPVDTFEAYAVAEFGNFNTRRAEAMVNLPVNENFYLRFAGSSNVRDGYLQPVLFYGDQTTIRTQRPLDDEDNLNGRASALYKFGDVGSFLLQVTAGHIGGTGDVSGNALYDRHTETGSEAREVYYNPMAGVDDDTYRKYNAELNLNLGAVHLTYTGGYLTFNGNNDNYAPNTGYPPGNPPTYNWNDYTANNNYLSQEIRISNATPGRFEYVAGANYWRERTDEIDSNWQTYVNPVPVGSATGIPCLISAPNLSAACNTPQPNIQGENQHEAKGIFGQANFHVTDAFKITAGIRWSSDSMFRNASFAVGPPPNPPGYWTDVNGNPCSPLSPCVPLANGSSGPVVMNDVGKESASKVTWRIGADYQLTPNQMIYGYVATGYKSGSFNDYCPTTHSPCSYGPEDMTAYEVGYKGLITPTLEVTSSIYYYDYSQFQLTEPTFVASGANGVPVVVIYTTLVPVTFYGWEGGLHWNLTPNDRLGVDMTVANGYYKSGPNHAQAGLDYALKLDWSGQRVDNLPPFATKVSYEHRFPMSDGGYFLARVRSNISGGYYETDFAGVVNGPPFLGPPISSWAVPPQHYYQEPFTRTDLDVGYNSANGKYLIDAYVRNIEDKMQIQGPPANLYAPGNGNPDQVTIPINAPRTYGVRMTVKF
jgi:iron complex outermembrane receptor protein